MIDEKYFGDPKLIWQDQIAGVINYSYDRFLGALVDLQSDPSWRQAFDGIATDRGVPEFLDRLQRHFDLCRSPTREDGSVFAYQHPSRTTGAGIEKDKDTVIALMKRYLQTLARAEEDAVGDGGAIRYREIEVAWIDDLSEIDDSAYARDGEPAGVSVSETMGDSEHAYIKGAPTIINHLREACYGLAASYELQRYLMQNFYRSTYDVDAIYELNWVHGCEIYFDAGTCYIYDLKSHGAWKDANAK